METTIQTPNIKERIEKVGKAIREIENIRDNKKYADTYELLGDIIDILKKYRIYNYQTYISKMAVFLDIDICNLECDQKEIIKEIIKDDVLRKYHKYVYNDHEPITISIAISIV